MLIELGFYLGAIVLVIAFGLALAFALGEIL